MLRQPDTQKKKFKQTTENETKLKEEKHQTAVLLQPLRVHAIENEPIPTVYKR